MLRIAALLVFLILPGLAIAVVCGCFALADWGQLQTAYVRFENVASGGAGLRQVFVAYAAQDIHRTNLFAEGVWSLLGALIAAIGLHGLCRTTTRSRAEE